MLEREEGVKEESRFRTVNVAILNKIIEEFNHLPFEDKRICS